MFALHAGKAVATAAMVLALSGLAVFAEASDLAGIWVTDDGEGAVEFAACGNMLCGKLVWMKDPLDDHGRPQRDVNNPDPAARELPVCGAQLIKGLKRQDDGSWDNGTVYDPEEGKSYSVAVKLLPGSKLEVTGYIGAKFLGETRVWTLSPPNLTKCTKSLGGGAKPR